MRSRNGRIDNAYQVENEQDNVDDCIYDPDRDEKRFPRQRSVTYCPPFGN